MSASRAQADQAVADAFPENADETVLIQSKDAGVTADDPAFRAVVDDVVAKLDSTENVVDVESPYFAGSEGAISQDGRSALVTFEIPDPGEDSDVTTEDLVDAPLATVAASERGTPRVPDRGIRRRECEQAGQRVVRGRLPPGGGDLAARSP